MLIFHRRIGQAITISDDVFVAVEQIVRDGAILGIYGPADLLARIGDEVVERRRNSLKILLRQGQSISLEVDLAIELMAVRTDKVRIAVRATPEVPVNRKEVYDALKRRSRTLPPMQPPGEAKA